MKEQEYMKRLLFGALAIVAVFMVAVGLMGTQGESADAAVNNIATVPTNKTANAGAAITVNIDADEGVGDITLVATAGVLTSATCDNIISDATAAAACTLASGAYGTAQAVLDDSAGANGGLDQIALVFTCPAVGPATAVLSVIQGSSVSSVTLTCRGSVSTVEAFARSSAAAATKNAGVEVTYIQADGATQGQASANINVSALDSAGNRLLAQTFVFTVADGALGANAVTAGGTASWATTTFTRDGSTPKGEVQTVNVAAGGKAASVSVTFAGNASTCTFADTDGNAITSIAAEGGELVSFVTTFLDSTGIPIPDKHSFTLGTDIKAVNPVGAGTFVLVSSSATNDGATTVKIVVGASGGTGVIATVASTPCNIQIVVSEAAVVTAAAVADGAISGDLPASGFGLVTFGGSIDQLTTALAASCANGAPIFATSGGAFVGFFPTTTLDAPNAAFKALFAAGVPANTPLLGGNC